MTDRTGKVSRRGGELIVVAPAAMPEPTWRSLQQRMVMFLNAEVADRVAELSVSRADDLRNVLSQWPARSWDWDWTSDADGAASDAGLVTAALQALTSADDIPIDHDALAADLKSAGFSRTLLAAQFDAVGKLIRAGGGGNFSVPGSGKTTMTYAMFALLRQRGVVERMVVVAPQSAYEAWSEEVLDCFDQPPTVDIAPRAPDTRADVVVLNYERAASGATRATIDRWARGKPLLVVFDEAHRAKRGSDGLHGRGAVDLVRMSTARLVLTGTPMPNGPADLEVILDLAWPGHGTRLASGAVPNAARSWVRVTKDDLGLEPARVRVETVVLDPSHQRVYDALVDGLLDDIPAGASSRRAAVMKMIAGASNPLLLDADQDARLLWPEFENPPTQLKDLIRDVAGSAKPAKLLVAARETERHANAGTKLVVWTNFLGNVDELRRLLAPFEPAVITGAVPRHDPSATTDRTRELRRFRESSSCCVLIATPQTLGEGVSLHHVSQSQLHVDRTFNAGLYLQALDRTHRVGMPPGTQAQVTVLVAAQTIDERIDDVLSSKLVDMDKALLDPTLSRLAGVGRESGTPLSKGEVDRLVTHLRADRATAPRPVQR